MNLYFNKLNEKTKQYKKILFRNSLRFHEVWYKEMFRWQKKSDFFTVEPTKNKKLYIWKIYVDYEKFQHLLDIWILHNIAPNVILAAKKENCDLWYSQKCKTEIVLIWEGNFSKNQKRILFTLFYKHQIHFSQLKHLDFLEHTQNIYYKTVVYYNLKNKFDPSIYKKYWFGSKKYMDLFPTLFYFEIKGGFIE